MTTIPSRMGTLPLVIEKILRHQTYANFQLRLYVPLRCVRQNCEYEIPAQLQNMQSPKFVIRRCDVDHGPATKIIPAMAEEALNTDSKIDVLMSIDDDIELEKHAIEELVAAHQKYRDAILGFMGVVSTHFFHSEDLSASTLQVSLLGGYRAVLYPRNAFLAFSRLFLKLYSNYTLKQPNVKWPYPVLDDDYVFARFAATFRNRLLVIKTQYPPQKAISLNILFHHNTDGVSGNVRFAQEMQFSRLWIDNRLTRVILFESHPKQRLLHIVCCSPRLRDHGKLEELKYLYGDSHIRFAVHPDFDQHIDRTRLSNYLKLLFHPTIRAKKRPHQATHVLVSHANYIVDTSRIREFILWRTQTLEFNPCIQNFDWIQVIPSFPDFGFDCNNQKSDFVGHGIPKFDWSKGKPSFANFNWVRGESADPPNASSPLLFDCKSFSFGNENDFIFDPKQQLLQLSQTPRTTQNTETDNLSNVVCAYMPFFSKPLVDHFKFRNGSQKQVSRVMYGIKDITRELHLCCEKDCNKTFTVDGTNAQMDMLFGDSMPGIPKQLEIILQEPGVKPVKQNTDWTFQSRSETELFVV